ncbi:MAG: PilZ domain-containing protein [Deltaproteobacteria bacterium]|nr:PilZ domain-containing protein [Deltaproteobacteria bacterium]
MEEERRSSQRARVEIPVTFELGRKTFFGTTANLSDDGMLVESSFARDNMKKVLRRLLKNQDCQVRVNYLAEGKSYSRRGIIKHYHIDFSGGRSVHRLAFGVWIPKLRIRQEKGL